MKRKGIKINIYYGDRFPVLCKSIFNIGLYASWEVKVAKARKILQQIKEKQAQEAQKNNELKEEAKEVKEVKENVATLVETKNEVDVEAKQTEEATENIVEGIKVEMNSEGKITLKFNADETDDIINPKEVITFIHDENVKDIKVEFISSINPQMKKTFYTEETSFAVVLDSFLQTHMYKYADPKEVVINYACLYTDTIFGQAHYDDWVDFMRRKSLEADIDNVCIFLNMHLCLRNFIAGNTFTLADIFLFFKMFRYFKKSCPEAPQYRQLYPNVTRWFKLIKKLTHYKGDEELCKYMEKVCQQIKDNLKKDAPVNGLHMDQVGRKNKNIATSYAGKLENAQKGKVVTRFPPEPSGFLHIGHAKAAFLNSYYANLYEGKMLLRFDDTNPALEDIKYENAIKDDLKELGLKYEKVSYTSQYFDLLEDYCVKLIKMGKAYADDTDVDTMRQQRGEGIESVHRNRPVKESLEIFEEMKKGTDIGQKNCIRARINMRSKNKCMRDPVIYRCIVDVPHHKYEFKYKCYPTYDFACPIIDSTEGITHALRTNEYSDRIEQYNWVLKTLELKKVHIYEFSRISFVRTVMSKRKLKWFVENNIVEGWDDPRMPTIKGVLRRGLCKEALFQFILEQGPSKAGNLMQWDKLWAINKQLIDPIIPRYAAVSKDGVHIKLTDLDTTVIEKERQLHMKNPDLGTCKLFYTNDILIEVEDAETLTQGEEITIIKLGNIIITDIKKQNENKDVDDEKNKQKMEIVATTNFGGDFKTTKKKMHWIPFIPEKLVHCILYEYDHLITVDKLDPDKSDWKTFVNHNSKHETHVYAEPEFIHVKVKDKLQFERRGYFIVDAIVNGVYHLIKIPDGKSKNMSIISSKVDAKTLAGTKVKEQVESEKKEN